MIYATADLHGNLPDVPSDAELFLIAGDICPDFKRLGSRHAHWVTGPDDTGIQQLRWLNSEFRNWLQMHGVPVIATWGNHDYVGEKPMLWPPAVPLPNFTMLTDAEAVHDDLRIWGTPWVPGLPRWAFYGRDIALAARAELIPDGIDILMTHGPPRNAGDLVPWTPKYGAKYGTPPEGEHVGDKSLNEAIERVRPKVTICGHIHEDFGYHLLSDNLVINVAAVDAGYVLRPNPWTALRVS